MDQQLMDTYREIIQLTETSQLKGKSMLYTSTNGYMYSFINKEDQLGFRLSKEDQAAFDKMYGAEIFKSHGAIMKDYVLIPDALLSNTTALAEWLSKSHQFVSTLKPK